MAKLQPQKSALSVTQGEPKPQSGNFLRRIQGNPSLEVMRDTPFSHLFSVRSLSSSSGMFLMNGEVLRLAFRVHVNRRVEPMQVGVHGVPADGVAPLHRAHRGKRGRL